MNHSNRRHSSRRSTATSHSSRRSTATSSSGSRTASEVDQKRQRPSRSGPKQRPSKRPEQASDEIRRPDPPGDFAACPKPQYLPKNHASRQKRVSSKRQTLPKRQQTCPNSLLDSTNAVQGTPRSDKYQCNTWHWQLEQPKLTECPNVDSLRLSHKQELTNAVRCKSRSDKPQGNNRYRKLERPEFTECPNVGTMTVSTVVRDNRVRRAQKEVGATADEQQAANGNPLLPNKLQEVRGASRTAHRQQPVEELDDFNQRRLPSQSSKSRTANRQQPLEELDDFDQRRLPSQSAKSSSFVENPKQQLLQVYKHLDQQKLDREESQERGDAGSHRESFHSDDTRRATSATFKSITFHTTTTSASVEKRETRQQIGVHDTVAMGTEEGYYYEDSYSSASDDSDDDFRESLGPAAFESSTFRPTNMPVNVKKHETKQQIGVHDTLSMGIEEGDYYEDSFSSAFDDSEDEFEDSPGLSYGSDSTSMITLPCENYPSQEDVSVDASSAKRLDPPTGAERSKARAYRRLSTSATAASSISEPAAAPAHLEKHEHTQQSRSYDGTSTGDKRAYYPAASTTAASAGSVDTPSTITYPRAPKCHRGEPSRADDQLLQKHLEHLKLGSAISSSETTYLCGNQGVLLYPPVLQLTQQQHKLQESKFKIMLQRDERKKKTCPAA